MVLYALECTLDFKMVTKIRNEPAVQQLHPEDHQAPGSTEVLEATEGQS